MKYILPLLSVLLCFELGAQDAIPQIFIKMKWKDSLNTPINLGFYEFDEDFDLDIKTPIKKLSIQDSASFSSFYKPYLNQIKPEKPELIFYVHGYSADSKFYQKFTNSRFQKHVFSKQESPYGLIVNLVWNKDKMYTTEQNRSRQKGVLFAEYILPLLEDYQKRYPELIPSIICHSMGNRILEGLLEELDKKKEGPHFKTIVMACPDLESDALHRSKNFKKLDSLAEEVILYVHNNDRVLTVATQSNKIDRLGHKGPAEWDSLSANLTVVDASLLADNKDIGSKLTNHRYFYTSPTGREDLMRSLYITKEEKFGKRALLDRPFRYVIEPTK